MSDLSTPKPNAAEALPGLDARGEVPPQLLANRLLLVPELLLLGDGPVRDHALVVSGATIEAVGKADRLIAGNPQLAPIRLPRRLLMPGFIDSHTHLAQAFGKALAFGEPSEIYRRIWVPLEGSLDESRLRMSARLAALEAMRGGFTTVCDAGARAAGDVSAIAEETARVGVRCVLGLVCNDLGADAPGPREAIRQRAERHLARWQGDALVQPSLAISIPEAASDRMLHDVSRLSAEAGVTFQTHANEHLAAVERSLVQCGLRPIEHLQRVGALGPQTLVAHATLVTPRELRMLRDHGAAVAYNPVASAWKGNAVAPALLMSEMGIRVGLGTDGTRSDAFRLLDAAETAQLLTHGLGRGDMECGDGSLWLHQALQGGADVLRMAPALGTLAPGGKADMLIVDLDVPELCPSWDLSWELVRYADRGQIDAVFVDGRLRLWRGWPVDWDARAFLGELSEQIARFVRGASFQKVRTSRADPA